jgi:hypothetical protein
MRPSKRSRRITLKMAWMLFWMSAILSLILVVKGTEEFRVLAVAMMAASATWLVGSYVWNRLMKKSRRSRRDDRSPR